MNQQSASNLGNHNSNKSLLNELSNDFNRLNNKSNQNDYNNFIFKLNQINFQLINNETDNNAS